MAPLNLPIGHHILARTVIDEKVEERKYTPITTEDDWGYFDLLIKTYQPNWQYSDGGIMSRYFASLQEGDEVEFSGPIGKIEYKGSGLFRLKDVVTKTIEEKGYS